MARASGALPEPPAGLSMTTASSEPEGRVSGPWSQDPPHPDETTTSPQLLPPGLQGHWKLCPVAPGPQRWPYSAPRRHPQDLYVTAVQGHTSRGQGPMLGSVRRRGVLFSNVTPGKPHEQQVTAA